MLIQVDLFHFLVKFKKATTTNSTSTTRRFDELFVIARTSNTFWSWIEKRNAWVPSRRAPMLVNPRLHHLLPPLVLGAPVSESGSGEEAFWSAVGSKSFMPWKPFPETFAMLENKLDKTQFCDTSQQHRDAVFNHFTSRMKHSVFMRLYPSGPLRSKFCRPILQMVYEYWGYHWVCVAKPRLHLARNSWNEHKSSQALLGQ